MGKVIEGYNEILTRLAGEYAADGAEIHEECGVFGVYNIKDAAQFVYYGLHSLQHRGQEACGIVTADGDRLLCKKDEGLVVEVFNQDNLAKLHGDKAIGHVRYSTAGGGGYDNVQPFVFHHHTGNFAVAHNGNIVNSSLLVKYLEKQGSLFHSTSDSEIIAHLIKKGSPSEARIDAIMDALNMIEGGFAFLILTPNRLYACRDKYGLRPLSIAKLADGYAVSSETCAFDIIGAEYIRDVEPGEIVCIDDKGIRSNHFSSFKRHKMCAMEYIYFARPDSTIEGCNVHAFRKESGRILYREAPAEADIVVGVPDSSLSAAIGYSEASGIPYEMGLIKNRYIGRTFIQPSQELRENGVRLKLSSLKDIVRGKRVVLIDDSIVRGTTSRRIVHLLKDSGASEVHVRIASPLYAYPCFYGVDTSTRKELIGSSHTVEEIRDIIGADTLAYLSTDGLLEAGRRSDLCMACFDGKYPTELYDNAAQLEI
ncbi:MAG: amidophosphoribosyltransferase [Bacteroidetes bacterium]|uniref:Amidophosphoribosyltransferase n=1 Tax=Candidatus Merdivivens pullicola TaxID=2840872 RepID=A0A9D9NHN0_9BACT|nr:amidophosphoribosyltransferase [Candidatus Merdivivens pullicola]